VAKASFILGSVEALVLSVTPAIAQTSSPALTRVKPAGPEMRRLILEGHARSAAFRALVDEIQRSNAIVVVQIGLCANGRIRSCVSNVDADVNGRYIRIKLNTKATDDRLIATIAHELQHAVEIVRDPETVDATTTLSLYRRIGTNDCRARLTDKCESEAALQIEAFVNAELAAGTGKRRPSTSAPSPWYLHLGTCT
jgi:hypothetical protein